MPRICFLWGLWGSAPACLLLLLLLWFCGFTPPALGLDPDPTRAPPGPKPPKVPNYCPVHCYCWGLFFGLRGSIQVSAGVHVESVVVGF